MTSLAAFSRHTCPKCGPKSLFDGEGCVSCGEPTPFPEVRIVTDYQFGQTPEQARKRLKRAAARERARGRGMAITFKAAL